MKGVKERLHATRRDPKVNSYYEHHVGYYLNIVWQGMDNEGVFTRFTQKKDLLNLKKPLIKIINDYDVAIFYISGASGEICIDEYFFYRDYRPRLKKLMKHVELEQASLADQDDIGIDTVGIDGDCLWASRGLFLHCIDIMPPGVTCIERDDGEHKRAPYFRFDLVPEYDKDRPEFEKRLARFVKQHDRGVFWVGDRWTKLPGFWKKIGKYQMKLFKNFRKRQGLK